MSVLTLCGIRGGVGTTSVAAMVGDALHAQDQSVLLIDADGSNMLRLLFNVPYRDHHGWSSAYASGQDWAEQSFEVSPGLMLLPYGHSSAESVENALPDPDEFWTRNIARLEKSFDWIVFDLPARKFPVLRKHATFDLLLAAVDIGCHLHLHQKELSPKTRLLATQFNASRKLSNDVLDEWQARYSDALVPAIMHWDESVHESMALKSPATRAFPESQAAQDGYSLATWLQVQAAAGGR